MQAGWDEATQVRRQVSFTKGRLIVRGRLVARGKAKKADFVLYWQHMPLALIEAKRSKFPNGSLRGTRYQPSIQVVSCSVALATYFCTVLMLTPWLLAISP